MEGYTGGLTGQSCTLERWATTVSHKWCNQLCWINIFKLATDSVIWD